MSTPSRLYRMLNTDGRLNLFYVTAGSRVFTDNDLTSITITRGADEPLSGLTPTVIEWSAPGAMWLDPDINIAVTLGPLFGQSLHSGEALTPRASMGRLATWDTDDQGGSRQVSTLQAVHWSSLLLNSDREVRAERSADVTTPVAIALRHPDLTTRFDVAVSAEAHDSILTTTDPLSPSEVIDTYAAGTGMQIVERRSGGIRIAPIHNRHTIAQDQQSSLLPILRRQGIAPATWRQPISGESIRHTISYVSDGNQIVTEPWPSNGWLPGGLARTVNTDWSNIRVWSDRNYRRYMSSLTAIENYKDNMVSSLTVDIALLLKSSHFYDQAIARQILGMETGDLVLLGGDWPIDVMGSYVAQKIVERITPGGWEIELSLHPASHVLGWSYEESMNIPAYTWDQMRSLWNDAQTTWGATAPRS